MEDRRTNSPGSSDEQRREKIEGPETPSSMDMQDSRTDEERLKQDIGYVDMPEVADIPGQEKITSSGLPGAFSDTTPSSDDEEGVSGGADILDEDEEVKIVMGTEADVTAEDLAILEGMDGVAGEGDDVRIQGKQLDNTDFDGELLNEGEISDFPTGDGLDLPVTDGSDPNADAMGQGDEENDYYSLGSDDNDGLEASEDR